ncbi:MAG TPA: hypothetical protein VMI54_16380 [Polyangiaceae bacterium]|nr:hypothetical protein [Polyangiaceae bacterium]
MRALVVATALFTFLGCSKPEPPPPAATATPSAAPAPATSSAAPSATGAPSAAPSASASPSAAASSPPPTEEDFEDEASKAVTAKSLDSQLDELEKEIQAD